MVLLDLFSGIGGFHLGLERAGFVFDEVFFQKLTNTLLPTINIILKTQKMSEQLQLFEEQISQDPILSPLARLVKILAYLEKEQGYEDKEVILSKMLLGSLLRPDQTFLSGKMLKAHSPQTMAQTFGRLSNPLPTLGVIDLNGNCLIHHGFYPKIESGYTLSDILMDEVVQEYFLSAKTIKGIMKGNQKPQLLEQSRQEVIVEDITAE